MIFERRKTLVLKEKFKYFKKILRKMFLKDTLAKISQDIFPYSFVSEHSRHFFFFLIKSGGGRPPPPSLADASTKNYFFYVLPYTMDYFMSTLQYWLLWSLTFLLTVIIYMYICIYTFSNIVKKNSCYNILKKKKINLLGNCKTLFWYNNICIIHTFGYRIQPILTNF